MKIETEKFGTIDFEDEDIIKFEQGIIGFPELCNFIIITPEGDTPFKWLLSLDCVDITFVIVNPRLIVPDYEIQLHKSILKSINAESLENIELFSIITIPENPKKMTVNLIGPIIINSKERSAKQIVLDKSSYSTKHRVITN